MTSFQGTLPGNPTQISPTGAADPLDRTVWDSRAQLASAMFEWIEGFYNPRRRHSSLGNLSPADYETLHTAAEIAA